MYNLSKHNPKVTGQINDIHNLKSQHSVELIPNSSQVANGGQCSATWAVPLSPPFLHSYPITSSEHTQMQAKRRLHCFRTRLITHSAWRVAQPSTSAQWCGERRGGSASPLHIDPDEPIIFQQRIRAEVYFRLLRC
jgi:hypothetical protein